MLSAEENALLTQIGPDTPMGSMIRRYWLPALLSGELPEPDGAPVRVRLMGEQLVAFRDTQGRVGLLAERCPHRQASLALARNEESGLRCIYHGWKMDVDGNVLDTPCEPATFRVKHVAYPTREVAGVVWAYLGPRRARPAAKGNANAMAELSDGGPVDGLPPFPEFLWLKLPSSQVHAFKTLEECNYAQALEGGLDHTHAAILHRTNPWGMIDPRRVVERQLAPRQHVQPTSYGFRYVAVRPAGNDSQLIRIINYIAPFWTTVPTDGYGASEAAGDRIVNAWVPRDDTSSWHFQYYFDPGKPVDVAWRVTRGGHQLGAGYRKVRNLDNWYQQDRDAMRTRNMSGLEGVLTQDHAVNETQGPILDRTKEHLGPSDLGVIAMRRALLDAIRGFMVGQDPLGLDPSIPYDRIAAATATGPASAPWEDVLPLDPAFAEPSAFSSQRTLRAES